MVYVVADTALILHNENALKNVDQSSKTNSSICTLFLKLCGFLQWSTYKKLSFDS